MMDEETCIKLMLMVIGAALIVVLASATVTVYHFCHAMGWVMGALLFAAGFALPFLWRGDE